MTTQELQKTKKAYYVSQQGRDVLIKMTSSAKINQFVSTYMPNFNSKNIVNISDDMILQQSFLQEFSNTESSNNLMVYLNDIERLDDIISDGRPILKSIDWDYLKREGYMCPKEDLHFYKLYSDLETNRPVLIDNCNLGNFEETHYIIKLPRYTPITEEYHYSSASLEKITKGKAELMYNRLQLYYFRELLTARKQEDVVRRIRTKEVQERVCLSK